MKTDTTLLEEMLCDENIIEAYKQVKRNKGAPGVDGMTVNELKEYLAENIDIIRKNIKTRRYKPSPVRRVEIPKDNGEMRNLGVPTVIDRVIQQAIVQVLIPIYEPQFSESSYGFRPNRCCEMAIIKALEYMNDGYEWVVDIDLEKFFDNVNHDKLISLVMKNVKNGEIVSLVRKFLVSGIMIDDEYKESVIGTPQGGNLSPLLSNIVLNELDKELEARGLKFVRYADDCIIMVHTSKAADRVMKNVSKFIETKLGLKVNMTKSKVGKPNEIKYLGFGFYKDKITKSYKAKPHAQTIEKFKKKIRQLTRRSWSVSLRYRFLKIKQLIVGWINYYRIGNFKTVCRRIDSWMRYRVRICIWKQWKTPQKRIKMMLRLGVSKNRARRTGYSRRGYARLALSEPVQYALRKEVLKYNGLVSLLDQYQLKHI